MCTLIEDVGYQLLTSSKSKAASSLARQMLGKLSHWDISGHYVVFAVPPDPATERENSLEMERSRCV